MRKSEDENISELFEKLAGSGKLRARISVSGEEAGSRGLFKSCVVGS